MQRSLLITTALSSLAHHKGRTALTMLGIIIGIASIIAIMAIGNGASQEAQRKVMSLGNNYIVTWVGRNFLAQGKTRAKHEKQPKMLTVEDTIVLKNLIPTIKYISPFLSAYNTTVTNKKNMICVEIKGGNEHLIAITGRTLKRGINFTPTHIAKGARVAILGSQAAKELFKTKNPIGCFINIKNYTFTVIGVLNPHEKSMDINPNLEVFIPYSTVKRYLNHIYGSGITEIVLSTRSLEDIPTTVRSMKRILRARHHLTKNDADDFGVFDQLSLLKAKQTTSDLLRLLLIIIASIALLVGGIGVMNIMLVSVTERTKEIGIRTALGAQASTILQQFLYESLIICSIGGCIGIGIGTTIPYLISLFTGWNVFITIDSIIYATFAIIGVGIIFGFYPAYKASRLNPIEALIER